MPPDSRLVSERQHQNIGATLLHAAAKFLAIDELGHTQVDLGEPAPNFRIPRLFEGIRFL